jgi:hypothetical protein
LKEGIAKLGGSADVLRCVPNRRASGRHQGRKIVLAGRPAGIFNSDRPA